MGELEKTLLKVLRGTQDNNIGFSALCNLLEALGFQTRTKGSHHIFFKDGIEEIINLQTKKGKAKAYQVKQVRSLIIKYKLGGESEA